MNAFLENISMLWDRLLALFSSYNIITDTLDIAFVAFLIFSAIKMLKETRGIQIVKGLVLVAVLYAVISLLNMQASTYLFKTILRDFILVLIILFTPEIRHALESMGRSRLAFLNFFGAQQGDALYERKKRAVLEICKACRDMSDKKIGALIVFERNIMLGDIINTGTTVDAKVSRELINSLFFPNSALHDGGVVIRASLAHVTELLSEFPKRATLLPLSFPRKQARFPLPAAVSLKEVFPTVFSSKGLWTTFFRVQQEKQKARSFPYFLPR